MKQKSIIRFTGSVKNLIPMGYVFNKLWARNYKAYIKHGIIIWIAGKSIGIKDLSLTNSAKIAHLIVNGEYPSYKKSTSGLVNFNKGDPKLVILNEETGEVKEWIQFLKDRGCTSFEDIYNYDHDKYTEFILGVNTFNAVKELHKNNMITIVL